jgi:superfamily II DNA or RNA helicase
MYIPKDPIIDNYITVLYEELKKILKEQKRLDVATGFFSLGGFGLIADELENVKKFRLLIGKTPDFPKINKNELFEHFKNEIKKSFAKEDFKEKNEVIASGLIDFLKREEVEVRLFKESFLHGKAYIFPNLAIIGSSNFTYSGLGGEHAGSPINTELNTVETKGIDYLRTNWFERLWNLESTIDFKEQLIELVENSKFGTKTKPYWVYMKALYELEKIALEYRLTAELEEDSKVDLAKFQEDGVLRVMSRMKRYGGTIVADSVGLGKTWIAKKIIEEFGFYKRQRFLVICPASIDRPLWKPALKDIGISENIIHQESLSREDSDINQIESELNFRLEDLSLIVVDESHNFRNPSANRYEKIFSIIERASMDGNSPKILFLTATPINNSIWDLYHQLMLITKNSDTALSVDGILDLSEEFRNADKNEDPKLIQPILNQIMIRRTRQYIKKEYPNAKINNKPINFPERKLYRLDYNLNRTYQGLYREIADCIGEDLKLAYYKFEGYKKDESKINKMELGRMEALSGILKTILLKRLESSVEAFRKTVSSQIEFFKYFCKYLKKENVLLRKKTFTKYLKNLDSEEETVSITDLVDEDSIERIAPEDYSLDEFYEDLSKDIILLEQLLSQVNRITPDEDAKLNRFKEELLSKSKKGKVIVFSYYADTLKYVFEKLKEDEEFMNRLNKKVEMIYGGVSIGKRQEILERFAPKANISGEDTISGTDRELDIIFSTDVLSEGQNLQDANIMINYDLHWNPTRMIQRAGRIDRLGSDFEFVEIYNFFPEDELEELLRLIQILQEKIENINDSVGLDTSVLGERIKPKVFGAIRTLWEGTEEEKQKLLQEEEEFQFGGGEEFWLPIKEFIDKEALDKLRAIPDGIKSGLKQGKIRGVFYAFTYEKEDPTQNHYYWYLYDLNNENWITNKREILQFIKCNPDEERIWDEKIDIYSLYDKAIENIMEEFATIEHQPQANARDMKMIRNITDELHHLLDEFEYYYEDPERIQKIEKVVEKLNNINHTKRRLKEIRQIYRDYKQKILSGIQFFNRLYDFLEDKPILPVSRAEEFERQRLILKAVEVIT